MGLCSFLLIICYEQIRVEFLRFSMSTSNTTPLRSAQFSFLSFPFLSFCLLALMVFNMPVQFLLDQAPSCVTKASLPILITSPTPPKQVSTTIQTKFEFRFNFKILRTKVGSLSLRAFFQNSNTISLSTIFLLLRFCCILFGFT